MSEAVFILDQSASLKALRGPTAALMRSKAKARQILAERGRKPALFILGDSSLGAALDMAEEDKRGDRRLLLLDEISAPRRALVQNRFCYTIIPDDSLHLAPLEEVLEILSSDKRGDYFIGGRVDHEDSVLILNRGDFESLVVPFSFFKPGGDGTRPDFSDFEVIDFGQALRLGEYEATTDVILYHFDADYRQRVKEARVSADDSFGGALRRLRLLRGLSRDDFPGLSAKALARLERGEVKRPRKATLELLAKTLGVQSEEIQTF
ncbi:helix-turn-helix domain-containing protein [Myxococcota bacterium]|nr:helix-turn-helix domain-containing protein [Myxococcota bacterium]